MGLLDHLSKNNHQRVTKLVVLLISIISIVSADVTLQNSYSTIGSETRESIYLHEMDYENSANIYQTSYSASSKAGPAENSNDSRFEDSAFMSTAYGSQGAGLMIDANYLNYTRSVGGGESNSIVFSYLADSGILQADYFTALSRMDEDITLNNNSYKGELAVFNAKAYSLGDGKALANVQSSMRHNMTINFLDKFNVIRAAVDTDKNQNGDTPLIYNWTGYSSQRGYALSGINIEAKPGNRSAELWIEGESSLLENKFSPSKDDLIYPYPLVIKDNGRILLKGGNESSESKRTLVMQYRLNSTSVVVNQNATA